MRSLKPVGYHSKVNGPIPSSGANSNMISPGSSGTSDRESEKSKRTHWDGPAHPEARANRADDMEDRRCGTVRESPVRPVHRADTEQESLGRDPILPEPRRFGFRGEQPQME